MGWQLGASISVTKGELGGPSMSNMMLSSILLLVAILVLYVLANGREFDIGCRFFGPRKQRALLWRPSPQPCCRNSRVAVWLVVHAHSLLHRLKCSLSNDDGLRRWDCPFVEVAAIVLTYLPQSIRENGDFDSRASTPTQLHRCVYFATPRGRIPRSFISARNSHFGVRT